MDSIARNIVQPATRDPDIWTIAGKVDTMRSIVWRGITADIRILNYQTVNLACNDSENTAFGFAAINKPVSVWYIGDFKLSVTPIFDKCKKIL